MNLEIIELYCIVDETCKSINFKTDPQCKMSSSEIVTFSLLCGLYFSGNYKQARLFSCTMKFFPKILSHSQLVRRIHTLPEEVWMIIFSALQLILSNKKSRLYMIDSMPIKAYNNYKSSRAKIFRTKIYHGYSASKKEYFFGIKLHLVIDENLNPVEFIITPGSHSDITTLQEFSLNLPTNSLLLADRAYVNYEFEDFIKENNQITLLAKRRKNLSRQNSLEEEFILRKRNLIESVFSGISSRMPKHIRANTEKGFCIKIMLFILAYMANKYIVKDKSLIG